MTKKAKRTKLKKFKINVSRDLELPDGSPFSQKDYIIIVEAANFFEAADSVQGLLESQDHVWIWEPKRIRGDKP